MGIIRPGDPGDPWQHWILPEPRTPAVARETPECNVVVSGA